MVVENPSVEFDLWSSLWSHGGALTFSDEATMALLRNVVLDTLVEAILGNKNTEWTDTVAVGI